MKIDLSNLSPFGNMTFGNALGSIFDSNVSTGAWAQNSIGWAGVDLGSTPPVIDRAVVRSASNGFDASGSASQVRLSLYGKNGTAPVTPTDGTLLGSLGYFTDPNASVERTIESSSSEAYRYVWVVVETGVWAILLEAEFYAAEAQPPAPTPAPPAYTTITAERTVVGRSVNHPVLLTPQFLEIDGFRTILEVPEDATALVDVRADLVHRGDVTGYLGVLSIGMVVGYRYATTLEGLAAAQVHRVPNAVVGCNLLNRDPHHYEKLHACSSMNMPAGFYEFTVYMNAATDVPAYAQTTGLAALLVEGGSGLNRLRIVIDKSMTVVEL